MEQRNPLGKAGAFISVTMPILIAIVSFGYYIINWNNTLTTKLDTICTNAILSDSLKNRDIA